MTAMPWEAFVCLWYAHYCAEYGIPSNVELIPIHEINRAHDRMLKGNLRYRLVIENANLKA